jgi:hypothetical protein
MIEAIYPLGSAERSLNWGDSVLLDSAAARVHRMQGMPP